MLIAIVRTLNEENNIHKFCSSYQWVDRVLIADGGSTDKTIEIAHKFENVEVREFTQRKKMENGLWRNPEAEHLNFLVEWAEGYNPEWIIHDDADGYPNYLLIEHGRNTFDECHKNYLRAVRIYKYLQDKWFPGLSRPKDNLDSWYHSIWAWRAETKVRFKNSGMAYEIENFPRDVQAFCDIQPPRCLIHDGWPTDAEVNRKLDFYRRSGQIPNMLHPTEFGGKLERLPEWAR